MQVSVENEIRNHRLTDMISGGHKHEVQGKSLPFQHGHRLRGAAAPGVEDALNVTMAQRSELDYLIYNDPLGYADLILNGDPEGYLKDVAGRHKLED